MATVLSILYLLASAVLVILGARALFHMKRATQQARRAAFLALTFGAVAAFFEVAGSFPPVISGPSYALGACLLLLVGARGVQA